MQTFETIGRNWVFQQDYDPKHTPKLVVELIKLINIKLKTSPDFYPLENTVQG